MTVKELIEALKEMPQDLLVVDMGEHVNGVKINHEYYDCDPCRPDAEPIEVVELT